MAKKKKATATKKEATKAADPAPIIALDNIPIAAHPRAVDITLAKGKQSARREDISRLSAEEIARPRKEMTGAQIRAAAAYAVQRPRDRSEVIKAGAAVMQSKIKAAQVIEYRGNLNIISVYVAEIGRSIVFDLKSFEAAYRQRIIRGA